VFVDGGQGAEEQAGDVGESSGAARRDASTGEKFVEGGEGVIDALGILEVTGVLGEFRGEVFGVGRFRGGVAGTVVGFGIEDAGGALAALGGAVLAALFVGWSWARRCGLHGVLFHFSSFRKFEFRWGVPPCFAKKRLEDVENKRKSAQKERLAGKSKLEAGD
jgi:hypothetical protein